MDFAISRAESEVEPIKVGGLRLLQPSPFDRPDRRDGARVLIPPLQLGFVDESAIYGRR